MIENRTHRAVYIPKGCDQQGRLEAGVYIRERQEQAADMARQAGVADTSDWPAWHTTANSATRWRHVLRGGLITALGMVAMAAVAGLLLAHWGAR